MYNASPPDVYVYVQKCVGGCCGTNFILSKRKTIVLYFNIFDISNLIFLEVEL